MFSFNSQFIHEVKILYTNFLKVIFVVHERLVALLTYSKSQLELESILNTFAVPNVVRFLFQWHCIVYRTSTFSVFKRSH